MTTNRSRVDAASPTLEPSLLVCERRAWWAPAVRRLAPDLAVGETRTLDECWTRVDELPRRFLVLEADASNLEELVQRLSSMTLRWGAATAAAAALAAPLRGARWLLREAGAAAVACDAMQLQDVVRLARRHLTRAPGRRLPRSHAEQLWQQLPWSAEFPANTRRP